MADPKNDSASPFAALGRLAGDEEASAAVEFIVLIPVYILLMAGLFMFANLGMARQALVQAARFAAWAPKKPADYQGLDGASGKSAFFGPYDGDLEYSGGGAVPARTITDRPIDKADLGGGDAKAREIAADVLNNHGKEVTLKHSEVKMTFKYKGLISELLGVSEIPQKTTCTVMLPNGKDAGKRPEWDPSDKSSHPVLSWRTNGKTPTQGGTPYYDPTQVDNMPLSPLFGTYFTQGRGTEKAGVWDLDARINGSDRGEHGFLRTKLPKR